MTTKTTTTDTTTDTTVVTKNEALEKILALIKEHSDATLAERDGMVTQLWNDFEISLQKSGSLLWQRNLHCMSTGLNVKPEFDDAIRAVMPHTYNGFNYVFINSDIADEIRELAHELC